MILSEQAKGIVGNIGGAEDTGFVLNQKEIGGGLAETCVA